MNLAEYIKKAPKKAKKKAKKSAPPKEIKAEKIETLKAVAPIVKVVEQPDYSPAVIEQGKLTEKLAQQAVSSMRDSVNNNQAVMGEIVKMLAERPTRFIIQRDNKGNMNEIIPVYE